jgi:hypothetical protein
VWVRRVVWLGLFKLEGEDRGLWRGQTVSCVLCCRLSLPPNGMAIGMFVRFSFARVKCAIFAGG